MQDIFKKIVSREIPAYIVWEDINHLAFLDINPIQTGHVLVIPKKQTDYIFDMTDQDYLDLLIASKKVANFLKDKLKCNRVCMLVEGYAVSHTHVHLIPTNTPKDLNVQHIEINSVEEYFKNLEGVFKNLY